MSIRGRLLLATAALVAVGLLVADGATYVFLRGSLFRRVDQQLTAAQSRAPFVLNRGFESHGPGGARAPDPGDVGSPETLFGRVSAEGAVSFYAPFGYDVVPYPPKLPVGLPGTSANPTGAARFLTTGAKGSSSRYRVLAVPIDGAQGTVVIAISLADADSTLGRLLWVEGLVTAGVLVALVALALWVVRVGLRPLEDMGRTADEIAGGELSRRVEPAVPNTEVGRLGIAINSMLERIESAFEARRRSEARLRRFVADASHELRTPLTSIRGYAELFRRGAGERPEDLEKTMRRIEDESARMGTLVDELLLLARLDQGRPLEHAKVDLSKVAADAAEDARAIDPGRPVDVSAAPRAIVEGDEARLRQVASNLVSNALTHTPPATPLHVRVTISGDEAILEVADEGPGLTPEQAEHVFDRFFRVDEARARANGGAGLGLSIVAAIAEAHGGRVWLQTAPGAGARFFMAVPVKRPDVSPAEQDPVAQAAPPPHVPDQTASSPPR